MNDTKKTVGAPTKYRKEYNKQAYKFCLLGYTDSELANFFDVSKSTLNLWKKEHQEFKEALRNGKDLADAEIVESLYNRAKGFVIEEVKTKTFSSGDIEETVTTKYIVGDVGAQKSWLSNRQRSKWRLNPDSQEDDKEGKAGSLTIVFGANGIEPLPDNEDDIIDFTSEEQ